VERRTGPASTLVGSYTVLLDTSPPFAIDMYERHAELVDHFPNDGDSFGFVAVQAPGEDFASLVVWGRFDAAGGRGPCVALIPETQQVFIGAGTSVVAYDRRQGQWILTWQDSAEMGFWAWSRSQDVILMSAELEFAAWTVSGEKLWTRFVEPPWTHVVQDGVVHLDVMGKQSIFPLDGPPA